MRRITLTLYIITISTFLTQCVVDTFDTRLTIINKTPETIFIVLSKDGQFKTPPVSIDLIKRDTIWDNMRWTPPMDSSIHIPQSLGSWENYINEKCKDSTLTIFVFDRRILKSVTQDSLLANQLYSKKYSYKVKDLKKLNWTLAYKE
jgi:hypothetical protein